MEKTAVRRFFQELGTKLIEFWDKLINLQFLTEIGRTSFRPFAFLTFRHVFYFAAFKESFHLYFSAAGTHKFLC
jgi:hypothetical protein